MKGFNLAQANAAGVGGVVGGGGGILAPARSGGILAPGIYLI
jgi:hypothetical protein